MKKLNITPGKVEADERGRVWKDESMTLLTDCWGEEDDAVLYADSHNTYHATQMMPSEMAERIKALEDALNTINTRLTTGTVDIAKLINKHGDYSVKKAWKRNVYASAIHAQLALGDALVKIADQPPIDEAHGHLLSNPE
jgi:hypothetical protein